MAQLGRPYPWKLHSRIPEGDSAAPAPIGPDVHPVGTLLNRRGRGERGTGGYSRKDIKGRGHLAQGGRQWQQDEWSLAYE